MGKIIVLTYDQPTGTNWVRKSRAHCISLAAFYIWHGFWTSGRKLLDATTYIAICRHAAQCVNSVSAGYGSYSKSYGRLIVPEKSQNVRYDMLRALSPLTPQLNTSAQRCLTRFFTVDFASRTLHFINICVKNEQIHQLFIQSINCVW
jgi:hypothetical protein